MKNYIEKSINMVNTTLANNSVRIRQLDKTIERPMSKIDSLEERVSSLIGSLENASDIDAKLKHKFDLQAQ